MSGFLDKLKDQIRLHEGVEKKVYLDTEGIETIGVGRNLRDRGLSEDEIDLLLDNDIAICEEELLNNFEWYAELDEVRKRVLIDMAFNLGMPKLKQFAKMLGAIENKDWVNVASEMLDSRWAEQVGNRASRLSEMMETGEDYILWVVVEVYFLETLVSREQSLQLQIKVDILLIQENILDLIQWGVSLFNLHQVTGM